MEEVKHLPTEVKDESSHLSVDFVPGAGFLHVEVVEGNIGVEEVDSVPYCGGVANGCMSVEDTAECGGLEKGGVEEIPLKVGEGEELFRRRHREPKMGDDPSFYSKREFKIFITPFRL